MTTSTMYIIYKYISIALINIWKFLKFIGKHIKKLLITIWYCIKIGVLFIKDHILELIIILSIGLNIIVLKTLYEFRSKIDGKVLVEERPYIRSQRVIIEGVFNNWKELEYQITFISTTGDSYFTIRLAQRDLDYLFKHTKRKGE
jgi:hypothetical protein